MKKPAIDLARSAASRLHAMIEDLGPRGDIGPLRFADDHSAIEKEIGICTESLSGLPLDLYKCSSELRSAAQFYAAYHNRRALNKEYDEDVVGCYKDTCRTHLRLCRALLQKCIDDKLFG